MPTTSNFGWTTPADTDLVKDGAAAIRTLGNGVDASFVDLKGGTTGQILSKNSNTDLDFTWIANDQGDITAVTAGTGLTGGGTTGAVTLTNDMATAIDAKGDLIAGTGADTYARLAVGANNTVLTADSTTATGLKWATLNTDPSWSLINTGGTALSGTETTISSISGANQLMILVEGGSTNTANSYIGIRLNGNTGSIYRADGSMIEVVSTYAADNFGTSQGTNTQIILARMANNAGSTVAGGAWISGCNTTGFKSFVTQGGATSSTSNLQRIYSQVGIVQLSEAITSVTIFSANTFDAGTVYVYKA